MKKITSLVTGHVDLVGKPISLLDEVITSAVITQGRSRIRGIAKLVVIRTTNKKVGVATSEDLISGYTWEDQSNFRYPNVIYVIGKFVPPDIHFIQNVSNVDLRFLMLEAWELRNKV